MSVRILIGDCRERLRELPDASVNCCVTSPPYFGLRDYGVDGQMGLEPTPDEFVAGMVEVFREVRRVLRDDGTLWLNIGDSYWTAKGASGSVDEKQPARRGWARPQDRPAPAGMKGKDLCGIPWMLAFALRAPDYLGRIRNEADRAWLAGLIDGEGCVSILETKSGHGSGESYPPILQVRMCDPECIEKAMALVGSESENPAQYPPSMEGQRPAYQWRIHGRKAADTLAEIYPFLLIKRKQGIVAWNHQAVRDSYETKRGVKIPAAALEKQKLCRELIQKLNKREPVDLPSWMIEPPLPVGPGWYLRQDVIWSKPNPMPESVRDRCTKAHEYLFLLSKSPKYYFDQDAIAEPVAESGLARWAQNIEAQAGSERVPGKTNGPMKAVGGGKVLGRGVHGSSQARAVDGKRADRSNSGGFPNDGSRNKRSVWEVATQPFSEAHFATYPPALIEPCILAGCPKGGTVLDPFGGAGTTGLVADRLGRDAVLIELNPEYAALAERRMTADSPLFAEVKAA